MRKGDARRQAILDTAERLFYDKGYEHTSVQDVLDAMQISKGGFYHHFESKLSLLEAICGQRIESGFVQCESAVNACHGDAIQMINILFENGFFFGQNSMDFVSLMVRVIYRDGCVQLKDMLQRTQLKLYLPLMQRIVHEGIETKLFYSSHPDEISRIVLMMNNCMTDEVAEAIANAREGDDSAVQIMDLITTYRHSVGLLLNAPYGEITMLELERAAEIIRIMGGQDRRLNPVAM